MTSDAPAPALDARRRRRVIRRRLAAFAIGVVAVAGGAAGVSAAAPGGAGSAATPAVGTIPPLPPPPAQLQAAVVAGAAGAAKPRVSVILPVQVQKVYATVKVAVGTKLVTDSDAYVVTNPGPNPSYGIFPDTVVTVMAFGSIPVQATIRLVQASDATNTLKPIVLHNVADTQLPFASDSTVTGTVLAQITDVSVDKVPLDVGPNCVAATPVDLLLTGHDAGGHRLPTDYNPFAGGPLEGTFTVPPFTGCGTGGDDLDPLLTGAVSGPGNVIKLNQGPLGDWDTTSKNDCRISNTHKVCPTPAVPTPLPTPTN